MPANLSALRHAFGFSRWSAPGRSPRLTAMLMLGFVQGVADGLGRAGLRVARAGRLRGRRAVPGAADPRRRRRIVAALRLVSERPLVDLTTGRSACDRPVPAPTRTRPGR